VRFFLDHPVYAFCSRAAEMEPGPNLWQSRDPVTACLCSELKDYFDYDVLLVNAFYHKSLVYAAHIQITKISNKIVKYW